MNTPGRDWKELAEPIVHEGKVKLRLLRRSFFTELLIYMDSDDATMTPFEEELRKVATIDIGSLPKGGGVEWPDGCIKLRIRLREE
jgi:hypothetical protein